MEIRNFDEVNVGDFHAQEGSQRTPGLDNGERPRTAEFRNNLTALSHDFDLYFAAYGDRISVTKPRNLQQKLPITPDLLVDLPKSSQAYRVRGHIDRLHPHDVNSIKVGKLGDFEILLIACDDGDLIAYYTHLLQRDLESISFVCNKAPISRVRPMFHENVGASAWGLSIHQNTRLIAVGTNRREVIVFALALCRAVDLESQDGQECAGNNWAARALPDDSPFTDVGHLVLHPQTNLRWQYAFSRGKDCRLILRLGPSGSNIPSIDFISDKNGCASIVLATDVNGNLWSFDLAERKTVEWPQREYFSGSSQAAFEARGWGVLCIPTSYFMLVKSPQEALGVKNLEVVMQLHTTPDPPCFQSLDISSSITKVGKSSVIHPFCSSFIDPPPPQPNTLTLESSPTVPPPYTVPPWAVIRSYVIDLLNDYQRTKCMLQQPTMIPGFQSDGWVQAMITLLTSEDWYSEPVGKWMDEIYHRVKTEWKGGEAFHTAIKELQFLLLLPLNDRYYVDTLDKLKQGMVGGLQMATMQRRQLSPEQQASVDRKSQAIPGLQEGQMAVIRTSAHDIALIPPNPNMLSTVCRNFLTQTWPFEFHFFDIYDRLNMFAVIPELSLLVVASQRGRVGLFTLTRLDDDFADVGPVLMLRLDRILPFTEHEKEFRPIDPLLGMAVGPLQGKDTDEGVQRKVWRLMLHYMDHTILSYELSRRDGLYDLQVF